MPIAALTFMAVLMLAGCLGLWFGRPSTPTLYLGEPVVQNGQGHLLISVADMPGGGVAAIMVGPGGLIYDEQKISGIGIEGLSAFTVAVSQFANGEGGFILVNIHTASENGPILRLTFTAHGSVKDGDVHLLADHITLVSDALALIDDWETPAYYAR